MSKFNTSLIPVDRIARNFYGVWHIQWSDTDKTGPWTSICGLVKNESVYDNVFWRREEDTLVTLPGQPCSACLRAIGAKTEDNTLIEDKRYSKEWWDLYCGFTKK